LQELDIHGNRLHYRKLTGEGPDAGWVTMVAKTGEKLVEQASALRWDGSPVELFTDKPPPEHNRRTDNSAATEKHVNEERTS
jgi:hypothetical protein